jgi:ferredoxin
MAYVITDDCVACGTCAEECPNDAIKEGEDKYEITDACDECGNCIEVCPTDAIVES